MWYNFSLKISLLSHIQVIRCEFSLVLSLEISIQLFSLHFFCCSCYVDPSIVCIVSGLRNQSFFIIIIVTPLSVIYINELSDSKSPQISRTLLSILVDLNNAVVWMVSTRPLISKSFSPCINPLEQEHQLQLV